MNNVTAGQFAPVWGSVMSNAAGINDRPRLLRRQGIRSTVRSPACEAVGYCFRASRLETAWVSRPSVTDGSSRMARRNGMAVARIAATANTGAATAKLAGSAGESPNKNLRNRADNGSS